MNRQHTARHDLPVASGVSLSESGDGEVIVIEVYCGRCKAHFQVDQHWAERWAVWARKGGWDPGLTGYLAGKLRLAGLLPP